MASGDDGHPSRPLLAGLSYFDYQRRVGKEAVIPWLAQRLPLEGIAVGDFGAHEGGVVDALRETGRVRSAIGFELSEEVVARSHFVPDEDFRLEVADVTALASESHAFDLILLHDVLEHVPDYERALAAVRQLLIPGGHAFISFPPYLSPFGGHQQLAHGLARVMPYVHFLPSPVFFRVARPAANEYMSAEGSREDMESVRRTRLTLAKAERAFARAKFELVDRELFLVRPEYTIRYGMKVRHASFLATVPGLRELVVNGAFYLLRRDHTDTRG
jgi:SAM-dependent methyltransferase